MHKTVTMSVRLTPDAVELITKLVDYGLKVDGYKDPREHLTLQQAAEEAGRKYTSFYAALMRNGQDLISRPFGPRGDVRITRGNLWEFLGRSNPEVR